jgi:hypothetical protein
MHMHSQQPKTKRVQIVEIVYVLALCQKRDQVVAPKHVAKIRYLFDFANSNCWTALRFVLSCKLHISRN